MSLVFRSGRSDDVPQVARLAFHSFPAVGPLSEWDEVIQDFPLGGLETLWVGEESGRIVAACKLFSFHQWIGGKAIPIMGLGMVAISAADRRRGIADRLCTSAFEHCRQRGDAASALYPFRTSFYTKLGYGAAGEAQQFKVPPKTLPDHPGRSNVSVVASDEDRAAVTSVYDRWAPLQTGQMERSPRAWERVWLGDTRNGVLYRNSTGEPAGYAIFHYPVESTTGRRILDVEEVVWLNRDGRDALHGWISSLSDQWDQVIYRAHPDEGFAERLSELRYPIDGPRWHFWFPVSSTLRGPMFRLLDIEKAWSLRSIRPGPPMSVALEVHDDQIVDHNGTWSLMLADGAATASRGSNNADLTLSLGIDTLSRLYIGSLTAASAVNAGLAGLEGSGDVNRLDDLLRLPRPWTFERF